MPRETLHFYEFGPYRVDPSRRLLLRNGEVVPLTPKAFDTLLFLVQNSARIVEKAELMKALWPDSFVEEGNLTQNVFLLRKAFGESATEHRYIVTVPGRGYRFAVPVEDVAGEETSPLLGRRPMARASRRPRRNRPATRLCGWGSQSFSC